MKQYLALFVPAYGVTLIAVPISAMIDHLGRGAPSLRAIATLPLWIPYTVLLGTPFVLVAAGIALLIQRIAGDRLHSTRGRLLFTLGCAGLGAAIMLLTLGGYALIAAAAGGTAAWVATAQGAPQRWRFSLVTAAGLISGFILGVQFY